MNFFSELSETGAFLESAIRLLPRLYGLNSPTENRPRQEADRTIATPPEKPDSSLSQSHENSEDGGNESNHASEMPTAPLRIPDVVVQSPERIER